MDQVLRVEFEAFVCVVTEASYIYIGTVATANIWGVTANIWGVTANIWGVNLSCKAPVAP